MIKQNGCPKMVFDAHTQAFLRHSCDQALKHTVTQMPHKPTYDTYDERMSFLASVHICRKCVSCSFNPLTGRSSLGNLGCLWVLLFSFVNVIHFSCVKSHSFLMRWPMWHYMRDSCNQALKALSHECRINLRMRNECHFFGIR